MKIRLLLFIPLLAVVMGIGFVVFLPKKYPVPAYRPLPEMKHWNLASGSRISYVHLESKGERQPYPIVFLQGGPGGFIGPRNCASMARLAAQGYEVFLYDQVGSGGSNRLKDIRGYTAMRHVQDLAEIVHLLQAEKVILIGQSWGAILAVLFAADYPEKVSKLVLTGPGPLVPVDQELAPVLPPDSLDLHPPIHSNREANQQVKTWRSEAMEFFAKNMGWKLAKDGEADAFQTALNNELNKSTVANPAQSEPALGGGGYYAQVMTVASFSQTPDPRPKLAGNRIPLLVLKGQYDNQRWGFTREYLCLFPDNRLVVVPGAGHAIDVEQPEVYVQAIVDFLGN